MKPGSFKVLGRVSAAEAIK